MMTPALLRSSKTTSKLHAAFIKTPTSATKQKYVTYRNKFKTLRNKMENNYYAAEFVDIKDESPWCINQIDFGEWC